MSTKKQASHSFAQTQKLGEQFAQKYAPLVGQKPIIFALQGELGSGKTQFVKGLAKGMGIEQLITSPSYTLVNEYQCVINGQTHPFVHIDAWRLPSSKDLETIGWSRFLENNAVIALEWAHLPDLSHLDNQAVIVPLAFHYESATNDRTITWVVEEDKQL